MDSYLLTRRSTVQEQVDIAVSDSGTSYLTFSVLKCWQTLKKNYFPEDENFKKEHLESLFI